MFTGGTALAGLILVFLGSVFTAFDSYDATQKTAVRKKYRLRAWLSFGGFTLALASGFAGIAGNWLDQEALIRAGIYALGLSFVLLFGVAWVAVRDIK